MSRAVKRGQSAQLDRLFEDNAVLAFLELDRLVGDLDVASIDLDLALVVVVIAVDQDLDVKWLALLDLRRGGHGGELDLGIGANRQRDREDLNLAPERRGRFERIAVGRVAVREQHDSGDVKGRDRGGSHFERRRQVGPLAIEPLGVRRPGFGLAAAVVTFFGSDSAVADVLISLTASTPLRMVPGSAANGSTAKWLVPASGAACLRKASTAWLPCSPTLWLRSTAKTTNSSRVGLTRFKPARARIRRTRIAARSQSDKTRCQRGEIDQTPIEEIDHGRQHGQAQQPPHPGQLELDVEWQWGCAHQSIHLR